MHAQQSGYATTPRTATPVAHRTLEQRVAHKRAREALHRRLDMLEADLERIQHVVRQIERAIPWLAPRDRARARRRLRELGHDQQLDAFADLHAVLEDAA